MVKDKLQEAYQRLSDTFDLYLNSDEGKQEILFMAVTKATEILVEYAWKYFKQEVESEGLDAPSPKEAVRQAAVIGLIDNPKNWINYINVRNSSVHDYFNLSVDEYLKMLKNLLQDCKQVLN